MTGHTTDDPIRPWFFGWRTGVFRRRLWLASWVLWTLYFLVPLWIGWLLKLTFDALSTQEGIGRLLVAVGISEAIRWVLFAAAIYAVVRWWTNVISMLRTNMLHAQTVSGGPHAMTLPDSPAEAISRFQDDTRDTVLWADSWLDGFGNVVYAVGALTVMATINLSAACVVLIPLFAVTIFTRLLTPLLHAARSADREATSRVSSFLGEVFSGQLAFRLAGREEAAVTRLERYTSVRRRTAVRDSVLQQAIDGIASSTSDVTIGLTLMVLVPSMRSGDLSVGDLALFVVYAVQLGEVPRYLARLITAREQSIVSYRRLGQMVAPGRLSDLVEHTEVTIEPNSVMRVREPDPGRNALQHLKVRDLTSIHPSTGGGVHSVDLDIQRGTFTVVTGGVGSGKSTLLRAIVGLNRIDSGSIWWNGEEVADPAAFFVPPNSAHLPQIPRLFSESLAGNITLGRDQALLADAIELSALTEDLADMPLGLETMVGSRGLRLSGGQAQRVATARSLLTRPELLVVDDLSSALDVATERELWRRLRTDQSSTVIAVSHRRLALEQADQVITMEAGRIVSVTSGGLE